MLGENIRKFRLEMKLTQEELAGKLRVSPQSVSKWERDECLPDTAMLPDIADSLGVSLDRLFARESSTFDDAGYMIRRYLRGLPDNEKLDAMRRLAYHCERSVFTDPEDPRVIEFEKNREFDPNGDCRSSRNETEQGFTLGSENEPEFHSVFVDDGRGFGRVMREDEKFRAFFSALSDRAAYDALLRLYRLPDGFSFDESFAESELGISEPAATLGKLKALRVVRSERIVIDGRPTVIWFFVRQCVLPAIFTLIDDFLYSKGFELQSDARKSPYIR